MGQFIYMKKKLNKLICILLCILLISLFVVPVFGTDYSYTLVEKSQFCSDFNAVLSWTNKGTYANTDFFISNYPTRYSSLINAVQSQYSVDTTNLVAYILGETSTSYSVQIIVASKYPYQGSPTSTMTSTSSGTQGFTLYYPTGTIYYYYIGNESKTDGSFYGFSTGGGSTTQISVVLAKNNLVAVVPFYITVSPTTSYLDTYYLGTYQVQPGSGGGGGSSGDVGNIGDVNWVNFATLFASYLNSNYTFTVNGTTYNPSYANVGWALAYMFECMENPTLSTITLDNSTMINPVNRLLYGDTTNPTLFDNIKTETVYISSVLDDIEDHGERIGDYLMDLASIYASDQEVEAREAAADNQQAVVDNFLDSQGDGSVSASNLGELADSSAEIKSNFNTGYSASGVWDVFDRNWDWFSNTTKNNLEPPAQNVRSANDYETPFLDNAINEILHLRGN